MKKIAFAGTFDPVTNGHLWVIQEALNMADEVLVIIAGNAQKNSMFDEATRKTMMEESIKSLKGHENVQVIISRNEYVAQYAVSKGCDYLIRGIRSSLDFDYETLIQKTNTDVLHGAKTVFVMPPRDLESVSSSYVKSLIKPVGWHWVIRNFVSLYVYNYWLEKYLKETVIKFCGNDEKTLQYFEFIKPYYQQSFRAYHNLDHLAHCLQELEWLNVNFNVAPQNLKYLCLALLGHDVIYGAKDKNNSDEELSAQLVAQWMADNQYLNEDEINTIKTLIEKTQYLSKKEIKLETELEKQMCSIDLAILAKAPHVYEMYAQNIRKENSQYSDEQYRQGRLFALEKLLTIPQLYQACEFSDYEDLARMNMQNEINCLSTKS